MFRLFLSMLVIGSLVTLPSAAAAQQVAFADENDQAAPTYYEGTTAYVFVADPAANSDPGVAETVTVELSSQLSGDFEVLWLTETGLNTSIFKASIDLAVGPPTQTGVLETITQTDPVFLRDTIDADYGNGAASDSAGITGSSTRFVDVYGRSTHEVPVDDRAYLRIIDPEANDPVAFDTAEVTVTALGSGDSEQLFLGETGIDTGTFEGSVALGTSGVADDGLLDNSYGETLEAVHPHVVSPDSSSGQATVAGSQITLVDAAGAPAVEYLEGTTAYVSVIDHNDNADPLAVETTPGTFASNLAGDAEFVSLTETGNDTGVFEGSVSLTSGPAVQFNGLLEITQDPGPPHQFDTISASHYDGHAESIFDYAPTLGGRIAFVDEYGAEVSVYATGSTVYLRAEDHEAIDYLVVNLTTSGGDDENAWLTVTSIGSGVFEGSIDLQDDFVYSYDGWLQASAGDTLHASFFEINGDSVPSADATVGIASLDFLGAAGVPTQVLIEGGIARLRLFAAGENLNQASPDTAAITLSSLYSGDSESLTLTETGDSTNIFEGQIAVARAPGSAGNGVLETLDSGPPSFQFDTVTAQYASVTATATTTGSNTLFIDAFGRETESYPAGDVVYVRVIDFGANDPQTIDSTQVGVGSLTTGDSEVFAVQETGYDTGVFEGSVPLGPGSVADDGLLDAAIGETIEAMHGHTSTPGVSVDQAQIASSQILFVDAAGAITDEVLQGAPVTVRVIDHAANQDPGSADGTSVEIVSEVTADLEYLSLTETGPDTGVFEGSIDTLFGTATPGDGVLDTNEDHNLPAWWDTFVASHTTVSGQVSASVRAIGSRIAFIDAAGNPASSYATGSTAYVRLESQNTNYPTLIEAVMVTLSSGTGDSMDVYLWETSEETGIYEGPVELWDYQFPDMYNFQLETQAGQQISASHTNLAGGNAFASADITGAGVEFIDEAGLPTSELLETTSARVRVTSVSGNTDPQTAETINVSLAALYAADSESLVLTETDVNSSVFEGEISLDFTFPLNPGTPGNGVLETSNGDLPSFEPEQVTASYGGQSATAFTVGSLLSFVDVFGQNTELYAGGDRVYLRVETHTGKYPDSIETVLAGVTALGSGDVEQVMLTETGFATSVFEGSVALGPGGAPDDGLLDATAGEEIEGVYQHPTQTSPDAVDRALISGSEVFFVDAEGALVTEVLQGARVYLRVIDHAANQDPGAVDGTSLELVSEVTGDLEYLSLTETGIDTGVFEGSMDTLFGTATPGDGVLDTNEDHNLPFWWDTFVAGHTTVSGQVSASVRAIGSRLAFIDAAGNPASSYATGGTAYVRLEEQNANDPAVLEAIMVHLYSGGDDLDTYLWETSEESGVFEGSINLVDSPFPDMYNGQLDTQAGNQISASYTDAAGGSSFASADVTGAGIELIDEAGLPTSVLLEGANAHVRVTSVADNVNQSSIDTVSVALSSLYGADSESLVLTEVDVNAGVFEGTIATSYGSTAVGDGVVQTSNSGSPAFLGDQVTASYGGQSAAVTTVGQSLDFVDAFGQDTEAYAVGSTVYLRVIDHPGNDPGQYDHVFVTVNALSSGDSEQVALDETGLDTAVFEGSLDLGPGIAPDDGQLAASTGEEIEAVLVASTGTNPPATDRAVIGGSEVFFVDAEGALVTEVLQGARVYLRVIDNIANGNSSIVDGTSMGLVSEVTGDLEYLSLTETGADTGVFEGSMDTLFGTATPGDGVLDTNEDHNLPFWWDTFVATHATVTGDSIASVRAIGSRLAFIDAAGNPASSYATGGTAYLRLEEQNANDPAVLEAIMVHLYSGGDDLDTYLWETSKESGVFEGPIDLLDSPFPEMYNGQLETQAGSGIHASYTEAAGGTSYASADITGVGIELIDDAGLPTSELLESASARVRVTSVGDNANPSSIETVSVSLGSLYGADSESLVLTELGVSAGVFEGVIAMAFIDPFSETSTPGDGVLETTNSFYPAFLGDTVTVTFSGESANAVTIPLRLFFVDEFGEDTEVYAAGDRVYLRLIDHSFTDPGVVDVLDAGVAPIDGSDLEQVLLTETGPATYVFEGSVALGPGPSQFDGFLDAFAGEQIRAERLSSTGTQPDQFDFATVGGSSVSFVDAAGDFTAEYLQASGAYVRVIDHAVNQDPLTVEMTSVQLTADITGDLEYVTLTETDADTGVFTGSINLAVGTSVPGDGDLTTGVDQGAALFDTLTATYTDASGQSQAMASTTGPRIAFIDGFGVEVDTIDNGLDAWLRVVNHAANDPTQSDIVSATVLSSIVGDYLELITLFETGIDTGIFETVITLEDNPVADPFDGLLQTQVGDQVSAQHLDVIGYGASWVTVDVVVPSNFPPAVTITAPADGSTFVGADSIAFSGTADDPEDGDISAGLVWSSDVDGQIGTGGSFNANLSIGSHYISAVSVDSGGRSSQAWIFLTVNNSPPVPVINSPADGANFGLAGAIEFSGTASDYEDGDVTASLQWFSDVDGSIGSGATIFSNSLSEGAHVITAMATDSGGTSGYASVNITLDPANSAPWATIVTPSTPSTFFAADSISFIGTADDIEDGDLTASLVWTSDLDGQIGTGGAFNANLSIGAHRITATVTDSGGLEGSYFSDIQVNDTPPTVSITAPADGSTAIAGDNVTFTATASDYEDGDLTANLAWSSDLDGPIGTGGSFSITSLSGGVHVITASVTDSGGTQASDAVTLTVNAAPSVSISAPADGSTVNAGDSVTFTGTANDLEDGDITANLSWSSDVDGAIGTGGSVSTSALSNGAHVITASVTDAGGAQGSGSIALTVNAGPSVSITAPADGAGFNTGDSASFTGSASDPEDGDVTASIAWSSDVDGAIGSGGSFSTSGLSDGSHVITASVTDAGGLEGSDTITITINAGPSVSITAPADGAGFNAGDSVSFAGSASDPEDGDVTASIAWSSDVDGAIGSGGSFSTSALSDGTHVITASVTDAGGLEGSDTITITVNAAPSVSITAPADGSGSNVGASVSFAGTASDPEDGDVTASVSWTSGLDGAIGSGGSFSTSGLSAGTHVITASVTDAGGLQDSDAITITVNAAPSVSITAPADGSGSNVGASVSFAGTASDPEDGDVTASLSWTSSLDGAIG
ncbi:MAG: hypothetical protein GY719_28490, partial [bacterium]|nr:hypothetical protein [bacterium]